VTDASERRFATAMRRNAEDRGPAVLLPPGAAVALSRAIGGPLGKGALNASMADMGRRLGAAARAQKEKVDMGSTYTCERDPSFKDEQVYTLTQRYCAGQCVMRVPLAELPALSHAVTAAAMGLVSPTVQMVAPMDDGSTVLDEPLGVVNHETRLRVLEHLVLGWSEAKDLEAAVDRAWEHAQSVEDPDAERRLLVAIESWQIAKRRLR